MKNRSSFGTISEQNLEAAKHIALTRPDIQNFIIPYPRRNKARLNSLPSEPLKNYQAPKNSQFEQENNFSIGVIKDFNSTLKESIGEDKQLQKGSLYSDSGNSVSRTTNQVRSRIKITIKPKQMDNMKLIHRPKEMRRYEIQSENMRLAAKLIRMSSSTDCNGRQQNKFYSEHSQVRNRRMKALFCDRLAAIEEKFRDRDRIHNHSSKGESTTNKFVASLKKHRPISLELGARNHSCNSTSYVRVIRNKKRYGITQKMNKDQKKGLGDSRPTDIEQREADFRRPFKFSNVSSSNREKTNGAVKRNSKKVNMLIHSNELSMQIKECKRKESAQKVVNQEVFGSSDKNSANLFIQGTINQTTKYRHQGERSEEKIMSNPQEHSYEEDFSIDVDDFRE